MDRYQNRKSISRKVSPIPPIDFPLLWDDRAGSG